jgi:aryl-alcohol dehydrogenase-like predicted oxidoreductase
VIKDVTLERVPLGETGSLISPLGVGAWSWGDTRLWNYGQGHGEADVWAAFQQTLAAGTNFVDTAEIYGSGRSETLLGEFLRRSGQPAVVATKFMPYPWRLRRRSLVEALQRSLDRLGMDCVDLYQVHWPLPPRSVETWMEGMAEAVKAGLTRAVGVSNHSAKLTRRAHAALAKYGIPLAANQVEYSLLHRHPERNGVWQACRELGITLIAYSPLAMGMLTGKYTAQNPPSGPRRYRYGRRYLARIGPLIDRLGEVGRRRDKSPAQVALNWVICKGAVPIPGAKNAGQASENAGALGWRLDGDEIAALDDASARLG